MSTKMENGNNDEPLAKVIKKIIFRGNGIEAM
jgi:hypothetical protein